MGTPLSNYYSQYQCAAIRLFYLRWSHVSSGSSSRDEIGLDDISVTATYSPPCTQPTIQAGHDQLLYFVGPYQMDEFYLGQWHRWCHDRSQYQQFSVIRPFSGINYGANSNFGNGDAVGGGFVVYSGIANGTGNAASTTVTGLSPNTTYYFYIFEYMSRFPV